MYAFSSHPPHRSEHIAGPIGEYRSSDRRISRLVSVKICAVLSDFCNNLWGSLRQSVARDRTYTYTCAGMHMHVHVQLPCNLSFSIKTSKNGNNDYN